jgi:hypothetical protein
MCAIISNASLIACATSSNPTVGRSISIVASNCRYSWMVSLGTVVRITVGRGWIKVRLEFLILFESSVQDVNVCVAIIIV